MGQASRDNVADPFAPDATNYFPEIRMSETRFILLAANASAHNG